PGCHPPERRPPEMCLAQAAWMEPASIPERAAARVLATWVPVPAERVRGVAPQAVAAAPQARRALPGRVARATDTGPEAKAPGWPGVFPLVPSRLGAAGGQSCNGGRMNVRHFLLVAILGVATGAMADNTGPTHPEKSREHPLDNREPRQDIIERPQERDAVPVPPPGSDD